MRPRSSRYLPLSGLAQGRTDVRFGETARGICRRWLIAAATVVLAAFTAMLALAVISPLGVQGADHPIDNDGRGASFQQSSMVTNVTVTNTPKEPGEAAQYTVTFVTGEVLQANVDTIVFDIDSSVWAPASIPADAIRISASAVTGGGQANQSVSLSEDPTYRAGREGRDIYIITVPDMDAWEGPGIESIDAGATVTVTFLFSAGLTNPTESGSYDFTVSTSKETAGVKATFTTPLMLIVDDKSDHRDKVLTVIGRGFKNGSTATVYLDRSRDADGTIVNVPDGMRDPGIDADLVSTTVESNDTFFVHFTVTVPLFAPIIANRINAIDDENPPNHYNGMGGQTPVTFTVEPLLTISSSSASIGGEIEISLVDWPATDRVMDYITPDDQGVDRVKQSAVTIAGIPQEIIAGEGAVGPDNEHTFRVRVGAAVPVGTHQLWVKTYTADQVMSNVPDGASDKKRITITDPRSVAGDRAALVALYNATDGENWTDNTNWLTDAPLHQWYGVEAYANGRVMLLSLGSNQLTGQIPLELGDLTNLWHLDLSENQLSGEIPAQLGRLTELIYLDLSLNQLSGEIPEELGSLSYLQTLGISNNQLTGQIPAELGSLTNLQALVLSNNRLSGKIPPELGNLINLIELSLSNNRLSGEIPAELGNLPNLWSLYLSNNRLTGCVPASLQSVAGNDLAELGLPFCAMPDPGITAGDRAALVALYNATGGANWAKNTNWLTDTPLGRWHGVKTDNTGRVTALDLDWNRLSGKIPAELGNLTNLEFLSLNVNQLSGAIPEELGHMTNLATLSLEANRLSGAIPAGLGSLANLTRLYLINNQLSGAIPEELGSLANLQILDLNGNRLTGPIPAGLGNLTNLRSLHLHGNQISGEIPEELGNLPNLTELDFSENPISGEIPAELGNLTNLRSLRFKGNQLSGEIPAELGIMSSLEALFLSHNRLSGPIPAELGSLPNLAGLFLNDNQLSGGIPAELGSLPNLAGLYLHNNGLSGEIPAELGSLPDLAGLFLHNNQLSGGIPAELGGLTNLEILSLSSNRLTGCVPASLRGVASHDLAELGLPFCDMLDGSPVVVIRFVSEAGAPVRLGSPVSLEAAFNEPVTGFSLEDISVANGVAGNFAGSGSVYAFEVTPNAIGEVTIDVAADTAQGADGKGNIASGLPLGIPYDDDGNGAISKSEFIAAINDYLFGDGSLEKSHVIALITLYLFGPTAA